MRSKIIPSWKSSLSALTAVLAVALPPLPAIAAETLSHPVGVDVEGERVQSTMYLRLASECYGGASIADFAAGDLDATERAYAELMEGLRDQDFEKVARTTPASTVAQAERMTSAFRGAFGDFQDVRTVCQYFLGKRRMFVWEWDSPKGAHRRAFVFGTSSLGSPTGTMVTSKMPLETVLLYSLQTETEAGGDLGTVAAPVTRFNYRLPVPGSSNPVTLQFDGDVMDFDLLEGGISAAHPALAAYQQAFMTLAGGDTAGYLAAFTPASRAKLQGWISRMPPTEFDSWKATALINKRIKFVLDAEPVSLIFYHADLGPEQSEQSKRLTWSYMHRDPASGAYRIANAYRLGYVDDLLKDESLFDRDPEGFRATMLGGASP